MAERLQYDLFERPLGIGADVADAVPSAEAGEFLRVRLPRMTVSLRQARRDLEVAQFAGLRVHEADVAKRTWIAIWNDAPKPFVWHKSADEILDSLAAYCRRINDSGH